MLQSGGQGGVAGAPRTLGSGDFPGERGWWDVFTVEQLSLHIYFIARLCLLPQVLFGNNGLSQRITYLLCYDAQG